MSKVTYHKCDVCGTHIKNGIKDYSDVGNYGKRFWLSFNNNLDICNECLRKLSQVKNDIKNEQAMIKFALDNAPKEYLEERNQKLYIAYIDGVEKAINQLFRNKVWLKKLR